jgi:RNA-directed DNA polymerase
MHRFDPLDRIICQREWIEAALEGVLANQGARTPGLDGITKEELGTEGSGSALVQALEQELREGSYHPLPIRRVYIPKGNGKHRPLGI